MDSCDAFMWGQLLKWMGPSGKTIGPLTAGIHNWRQGVGEAHHVPSAEYLRQLGLDGSGNKCDRESGDRSRELRPKMG